MKLNVSFPQTGCQKLFEIEDERKLRVFFEKQMGHEVEGDSLGEEWKGYIFRISGGNDKQGFPMKQGVLTNNRVRLLLSKGHSCYRPRRSGERKRKSVRGCIVDANLSVLALVIVKKGVAEIPGLTDKVIPRRLGPKRASNIRKLFNLDKKDDVRRYVIKRPVLVQEGKKTVMKAPKIQRLITPSALMHRRHKLTIKRLRREKNKENKAEYAKMLASRLKEARNKKKEASQRRKSSMRDSKSISGEAETDTPAKERLKKNAGAATAKAVGKKVKGEKGKAKVEAVPAKTVKEGKKAAKSSKTVEVPEKPTGKKSKKAAAAAAKDAKPGKSAEKPTTAAAPKQSAKAAAVSKVKGKASGAKATGKVAPEKPATKTAAGKTTTAKAAPKTDAAKPTAAKAAPKAAAAKAAPKAAAAKAAPKPAAVKAAPKPAAAKAAPKPAAAAAPASTEGAKPKKAKKPKK